jgi:hypothetical protein
MRVEVGVLRIGPRLHLTPVAVEDVLTGIDEHARLGHRRLVEQVLGHVLIVRSAKRPAMTETDRHVLTGR